MEIKLVSSPVIEYNSIAKVGEEVKAELAKYNINSIVPTEENLQTIKAIRTKFGKMFKEYEETRKMIKKAVNEPYEAFEVEYKKHIANLFNETDNQLKGLTNEVESKLLSQLYDEIQAHFDEVAESKGIDFVRLPQANINIIRSASKKSLKDKVDEFLNRIESDLNLIESQEHKERILVRYKQILNVSQAITSVLNEVKQEQELLAKKAEIKPVMPVSEPVEEVVEVMEPAEAIVEELLTAKFTVTGTLNQLKALKAFMQKENIKYE